MVKRLIHQENSDLKWVHTEQLSFKMQEVKTNRTERRNSKPTITAEAVVTSPMMSRTMKQVIRKGTELNDTVNQQYLIHIDRTVHLTTVNKHFFRRHSPRLSIC